MMDHGMLQLLCNVARLEAGAAPVINEGLAKEAISRGFLIRWRDGYMRTRLGKAYLKRAVVSGEIGPYQDQIPAWTPLAERVLLERRRLCA